MEAWGIQDHASRFVIIPNPEDTSRTTTPCHQRNYSESSLSSLASFHGPPTPPSSSSSPCFPASPAVSYCVDMSQEEEGPLVYTTDSPMGGGSEYDYPGGSQGFYGAPQGGSSSDGARYVESPPRTRAYLETPGLTHRRLQTTNGYCCLVPGCKAVPFRRNADLDRHYKHKHRPDERKESYYCDYPKCSRRDSPFHRRDHFRDHLRDYHKEDIAKRGRPVHTHWVVSRNVKKEWWRCTRCLSRVMVEVSGFECPGCKTSCDVNRVQHRNSPQQGSPQQNSP